jgi:membrane associated rhomboid family serine protease
VALPLHDFNHTKRRAVVTLAIIAINVFVYAVLQPHDGGQKEASFSYEHAAIPCELDHDHPLSIAQYQTNDCSTPAGTEFFPHKNVWLAVVVSMFLHASWIHVLGNMWFLWVFGNNVEDYLGKIGYVLFYLLAGIVAASTYAVSDLSSLTPVIGASGAIAGVMGMYLVLWPRAKVLTLAFGLPIPLPAYLVLASWFGLQFLTDPNSGVAWVAHVGGFVGGALIGLALRQIKPPTPKAVPA